MESQEKLAFQEDLCLHKKEDIQAYSAEKNPTVKNGDSFRNVQSLGTNHGKGLMAPEIPPAIYQSKKV